MGPSPPFPPDQVASALRLADRELVAFVGGHGKTLLMLAIARELSAPVVLVGTGGSHRFAPKTVSGWLGAGLAAHVLVRAGSADGQPFTVAPPTIPPLPIDTTLVVACIGAEALGKVIADRCDRPLWVAAAAGCSPYQRLTPERAANALLSERGSRRGQPPGSRFVVVVLRTPDGDDDVDELGGICASRDVETIRVGSPTGPD